MARETLTQTSFNAGVLSPRFWGRTDWQKYANSVAELSNCIPLVAGPITFRPGTSFIKDAYNHGQVRLIPFKYSTEQAYMLEFSDNRIRFFKDRGIILSTTAVTNGTFATDLTGWTGIDSGTGASTWSAGSMSLAGGAGGVAARTQALTYMGISQYTVTCDVATNSVGYYVGTTSGGSEIASGTLTTGVSKTFNFTPTTAGTVYLTFRNPNNNTSLVDNVVLSTPEYAINTPYETADLEYISYAQDRNVIYFALKSTTVKTKVLTRTGHAQWTLSDLTFVDGPYLENNSTTTTLTPSHTSGTGRTMTASSAVFASTDIGRLIRFRYGHNNPWGYCTITGYTSPTVVTVDIDAVFDFAGASTRWRLGAFCETTGYPGVVTLHEFRMFLANNSSRPNTFWASEAQGVGGTTVLYAPTVVEDNTITASNAFFGQLTAGDVSEIAWMSSGASLVFGTEDSEWVGEPGDTAEGISPTNFRVTRRTNHGSLPQVSPVRIDGTVMYAKGTGTRVNKFVFDFSSDKYMSTNLSLQAETIFAGKTVAEMVYQPEPFSLMWVLFTDGTLASVTYVDSEEVGGWASHSIAGVFEDDDLTYGVVESIAVIPASDRSYSEVWMVVKRTMDGQLVRFIEVLEDSSFGKELEDAIYVDSALTYSGVSTTTLSGLTHLEGSEVVVFSNGYRQANKTVESGQITLDEAATKVVVGLEYIGNVETLDFETTNGFGGSSMGQIRRISSVAVRLYDTVALWANRQGLDDEDLNELEQITPGHLMGVAPEPKSGIFKLDTAADWDLSSGVHLQMRSPFPATVTALMIKAQVNEG